MMLSWLYLVSLILWSPKFLCCEGSGHTTAEELYCTQKNFKANFELDFHNINKSERVAEVQNVTVSHTGLRILNMELPGFSPYCLDLSGNRLHDWPAVNSSAEIRLLNLSANFISTWNAEIMKRFSALEILDLSENNLPKLDLNALLNLPKLQVIFLHGNPTRIFGELKYVPNLETVVLSTENWYAVNNIDFGTHPVSLVLNTSAEASRFRFRCTQRLNSSSVAFPSGFGECNQVDQEVFWAINPKSSCINCYTCRFQEKEEGLAGLTGIQSLFANSEACNCRIWLVVFASLSLATGIILGLLLYALLVFRHNKQLLRTRKHEYILRSQTNPKSISSEKSAGCPYSVGSSMANSPLLLFAGRKTAKANQIPIEEKVPIT